MLCIIGDLQVQDDSWPEGVRRMRQHEEGHVEEGGAQEGVLDRLSLTFLAQHVEPHHGPQERVQLPVGRGHGEQQVEAVALDHLADGAKEALHRLGL